MKNKTKGILAITASAFGFALMAFFVRLCDEYGPEISSFQKSFFRNFIALLIAAFVFYKSKQKVITDSAFHPKAAIALLIRCIAGSIGIFANFYALSKIPIADAMAINKTAPFFTVFFSWLILREKTRFRQFLAIIIAIAGVCMVLKPSQPLSATLPSLIALLGGLGAGIAYTCVRQLGIYKVSSAFIVLFFSAFSSLVSIPLMLGNFSYMTMAQVLILLMAGASAAIGQFGITMAYTYAPAKNIAVFDYSNIIFTAILGFAFFGQVPDIVSAIGFATIIFAAYLPQLSWRQSRE